MTSLSQEHVTRLAGALWAPNRAHAAIYVGESGERQPVHTVYGGAHLFATGLVRKLGDAALAALDAYAPNAKTLARALEMPPNLAARVYTSVRAKLAREPVEDLRIDFEDGYGARPDAEEDQHAAHAARELARAAGAGLLPPFCGIRTKPFSEELFRRSLRTVDIFVTTLVQALGGVPAGFVVCLPKITHAGQVAALAEALAALEAALELTPHTLKLELMIEMTQTLLAPDGRVMLPALLDAARGRCVAAHFGTYDYTASANVTAAHQHMGHPACVFARQLMQVAYGGRGIRLADGATHVMPVPRHRGAKLSPAEKRENREAVHAAWRQHARDIRQSLELGFYQGWDLHPAQLPSRFAAVYGFFLAGLGPATLRLRNFLAKAAQATLLGDVFDDAATGQGLLNFFLRGIHCGALSEEEALATGVTLDELKGKSFAKILERRRAGG